MRLDVWLWSTRVYKTRSNAVEAIRGGHVELDAVAAKPAREVKPGDVIRARVGDITRVVRVVGFPPSRVGAALVPQFAEDLTPPEEIERARQASATREASRPRGLGRPTKRDRRLIQRFIE
jgi:ribosome-associated heat shock protein Hsp15